MLSGGQRIQETIWRPKIIRCAKSQISGNSLGYKVGPTILHVNVVIVNGINRRRSNSRERQNRRRTGALHSERDRCTERRTASDRRERL